MAVERAGAVTLAGNPLTLLGKAIKVGDKAPDFRVLANDFSEVTLSSDKEKTRIILSLPSLDTGACDMEARRFNEEAAKFPENVVVYAISCDLPFAQARWCGSANVNRIKTFSDHKELSFGEAYGTWVKESRLLSRAVFLVDSRDVVKYVEYVKEIDDQPNFGAVVATVQKASR